MQQQSSLCNLSLHFLPFSDFHLFMASVHVLGPNFLFSKTFRPIAYALHCEVANLCWEWLKREVFWNLSCKGKKCVCCSGNLIFYLKIWSTLWNSQYHKWFQALNKSCEHGKKIGFQFLVQVLIIWYAEIYTNNVT